MKKLKKRNSTVVNTVENNSAICICWCAKTATKVTFDVTIRAAGS